MPFDPGLRPVTMTSFLLIRHALCDPVGHSIAGRQPGIHLNEIGRRQAQRLAERLKGILLAGLYTSPLERASETARVIGNQQGLEPRVLEDLNEIDFGEWTGKTLAGLDPLPDWHRFNSSRTQSRIPGGETMEEVLNRALGALQRLRVEHPQASDLVAVVSHGDVLRALLAHALGMSLDLMQRLELSPASISVLELSDGDPRVLLMNSTGDWP